MIKEVKIAVAEHDVYADGITKIATKVGDVVPVNEDLAASMVKAGLAVYNDDTAPEESETTPAEPKVKTPEAMTKPELKAFAAEQGIELDETKTKVEMLAAFNEALAK